MPVTRTHDLVALLAQCLSVNAKLADLEEGCRRLTYYAVTSRYPDDLYEIDEEEGAEMVLLSQTIQERVVALLPR